MKQIASALVKAQKAFGPALKTSTNPHFKSRYADLSACIEAVVDALNSNGIALVQQSHECADGVIVETVFVHESGETFSSGRLHVPSTKHDAQGYGSALTYARRYSLMAACGIAPEDDDGNAATKKKPAIDNNRLSQAIQKIKEGAYTTDKLRDTFALTAEQEKVLVGALANE
jgi:ERF superfamily